MSRKQDYGSVPWAQQEVPRRPQKQINPLAVAKFADEILHRDFSS
jgi:hypothetical protein